MVGSVAGAATGFVLNKAFGGGSSSSSPSQARVVPTGNFGGLTATSGGAANLTIAPKVNRATAVGRSANVLGRRADELAAVRAKFRPGFGALTSARLSEIENARSRSVGNLRENLARRRLAGSSFASDAIARADREFGQAAAEARATSLLQELDVTTQLIGQEFTARQAEAERAIQELDFQADVATRLLAGVSSALQSGANLEAQLAFDAAQGAGAFFEPLIEGVSNFANDAFSGSSGGPSNFNPSTGTFGRV